MTVSGVIVALLTPFDDDGIKVDFERLRNHVKFLLDRKIHGFFTTGTVGEGILLDTEERKQVLETVIQTCNKRVPVIAHVGHVNTSIAVELAKHARESGADAIATIPPYYFPLDDAALLQYFRDVAAAASSVPFYVYNYPDATNNSISAALLQRLVETVPNLKGFKDSSKSLECFEDYRDHVPGLDGIVGSDTLILEVLKAGGQGVISTVANVFPDEVLKVYEYFQSNDLTKARAYQALVDEARKLLKSGPYITTYKAAMALQYGKQLGGSRVPLRGLDEKEWEKLKQLLADFNILRERVVS
jgi:dihydrodipicolinate synthase/N-acetylneuraminate lyase